MYWVILALVVVSIILIHSGNGTNEISFRIIFFFFGFAEIARLLSENAAHFYPGNEPLRTIGVLMLLYASCPLFMLIRKKFVWAALILYGLAGYCGIVAARFLIVPTDFISSTYFEFMLYWIIGALCAELFSKCPIDHQ